MSQAAEPYTKSYSDPCMDVDRSRKVQYGEPVATYFYFQKTVDLQLLESLLYQEESEALDFKVQQYPFSGANDDEKSELLKDILAFANAWRQTDAHILIGVQEVRGGRSIVHGI